MELASIVAELARGLLAADALRPIARSQRGTRLYQPGIGPHAENAAIALALAAFTGESMSAAGASLFRIPASLGRSATCGLGSLTSGSSRLRWRACAATTASPDDTAIKDILSPYESDRSALADCTKLANAEFNCRKAIVIYGFDYPDRPLDPVINAFELLAARKVQLGQREVATFGPLVHPVHAAGRVFGWEVKPSAAGP